MRKIYGFLRLASLLANPFGHPSQVSSARKFWFCKLTFTCVDLRKCRKYLKIWRKYPELVGYVRKLSEALEKFDCPNDKHHHRKETCESVWPGLYYMKYQMVPDDVITRHALIKPLLRTNLSQDWRYDVRCCCPSNPFPRIPRVRSGPPHKASWRHDHLVSLRARQYIYIFIWSTSTALISPPPPLGSPRGQCAVTPYKLSPNP